MPTINVLRPFVFSRMVGDSKRATETKFTPGLHEVDDDIANHPYIAIHFADGKIESPAQTKERLETAAKIKAESDARAAVHTERASKAYARVVSVASDGAESAADIEAALHTPVGELQRQVGQRDSKAIDTPVTTLKLGQNRPRGGSEVSMTASAAR